ncbi:unnamed protein product [Prorocentrum cordatum]|uniref:Glycoside hydrolase family 2 catalytic domain-containing protein n=1 Tax=Prorocentrum cordatum TaxID=2364126 RepID=A0ABN9QSJ0_9DINO|nr:unnamed protein product [Polarella glacialis]
MQPDAAARRPRLTAAITATRRLVFVALALLADGHAAEAAGQRVRVQGQQLLVDGEPFHIKGVCWNPVPKGGTHPQDLDYRGFVAVDSELMASAGINAVRTYEAINDTEVLDVLWEKGIYVMNTVYSWGGLPEDSAVAKVRAVMHHPAILMWLVGNEWNYNGLYYGLPFEETLAKVSKVVDIIKEVDQGHPVATVHGELPSADTLKALSSVDIWGVNKYSGLTFGDLFDTWSRVSELPMFLGEYGADAYDARAGQPNEAAQAEATSALSAELLSASSAANRGPCIGGAVFELADEWWKDGTGSPGEHDVGGVSPGGGPWPDMTFNEEWWGLVRYDGTPRQAFRAYARSNGGWARRGGDHRGLCYACAELGDVAVLRCGLQR